MRLGFAVTSAKRTRDSQGSANAEKRLKTLRPTALLRDAMSAGELLLRTSDANSKNALVIIASDAGSTVGFTTRTAEGRTS
jgi:hypothetical protein